MLLILLASYQAAQRHGLRRIGTGFLLAKVAEAAPAGERLQLPDHVLRQLRPVLRATTPSAHAADEAGVPVADDATREEIDATLREVTWRAVHQYGRRARATDGAPPVPSWSEAVPVALARALHEANGVHANHAGGVHLLVGLLTDEHSAAATLLRSVDVDPVAIVAALRANTAVRTAAEPYAPLIASLEMAGGIELRRPRLARLLAQLIRRRISRTTYGPVLGCLELEMMRQAVRLNSQTVMPAHVLLAMLSLDHQLQLTSKTLTARSTPFNTGADILRRAGVDRLGVVRAMETNTADSDHPTLAAESSGRLWQLGQPAWQTETGATLDRSVEIARGCGHPEAGTLHLLAALLERAGPTNRLLDALGADSDAIRDDVNRALSAL